MLGVPQIYPLIHFTVESTFVQRWCSVAVSHFPLGRAGGEAGEQVLQVEMCRFALEGHLPTVSFVDSLRVLPSLSPHLTSVIWNRRWVG